MKTYSVLGVLAAVLALLLGGVVSSQATPTPSVAAYEASVDSESNLVSYYSFNATNANDSIGTNNGTLQGTASYTNGAGGSSDIALNLNGSGWDNLGSVGAFDFSSGQGTVEVWVLAGWTNTPAYNPCIFADRDNNGTRYSIHMSTDKTKIYFWNGTNAPTITLPAAAGTNWHRLGVEFNAGNWTVIWDGQIAGTGSLPLGSVGHTVQLGSSTSGGSEEWIGRLDNVAFSKGAGLSGPRLISYYSFEALTVNDDEWTNNGALQGTPFYNTGVGGGADVSIAMSANGWVNLGSVPAFDFTNGQGTVELWVYPAWPTSSPPAYYPCIYADRDSGGTRYSLHMSPDKTQIAFWNGTNAQYVSLPAAAGLSWHHCGVVFNAGNWTLVWDGKSVATNALPLGSFGHTVQLASSSSPGSEEWYGFLDEVAFYGDALTVSNIQTHYNAATTPVITVQPQGSNYWYVGQPGLLSITVDAIQPSHLGYQWYKGASVVAGETNSTFHSTSLVVSTDGGTYTCVVTNYGGSVTSSPAVVVISIPLTNYQAVVLADTNLISYYKFDDSTARDDFGTNNGVLQVTTNYVNGVGGGPDLALNLNSNGWDNLGSVPAFNVANGAGTVELWLQADWTNVLGYWPCIFASRDTNGARYSIHMTGNKGVLTLFNGTNGMYAVLPAEADLDWHYLAVGFNATNWSVVWDGQSLATFAMTNAAPIYTNRDNTVQLGSSTSTGSELWIGNLDEVAFYNAALPLSDIQAHYNAFNTNNIAVLSVRSFGAVVNSSGDSAPAIRQAIKAAIRYGPNRVVTFEPGTYNISPDGVTDFGTTGDCLNMQSANGLSLQGSKTTLIVTNPLAGGLNWAFSTNCSVSGLTLDYNPLPFTQGTITAINTGAGTFDVAIASGYPLPTEARFTNGASGGNWAEIIDSTLPQPKAGTDDYVPMSTIPSLVSGSTYRFTPTDPNVVAHQIAVNDRFVYVAVGHGWGFTFNVCTNCVVRDVIINTGPNGCMVVAGGYGMVITNFSVSFPPNSGRLLTSGGGIACVNARGGPTIINSYFEGMADDGLDLYSIPSPIIQVFSSTSIMVGFFATFIQSGDRIQVFDIVHGVIRGETTATNVVLTPTNTYLLTLAAPISGMVAGTNLDSSDSLFNLSASGEGYLLTNNIMNGKRGHGFLLRTGNGTVVSNQFNGCSQGGILIGNASGPDWEGPLATNILVCGNTVNDCGYADDGNIGAITVIAYGHNYIPATGYCQRNITIQNNIITNWPQMGILAASVTNLNLFTNQVQSSATWNSYGGNIQGMVFQQGGGIVVKGGSISDPRTNLQAGIHVFNTVAAGTAGFSTNNLIFNLAPGVPAIIDNR